MGRCLPSAFVSKSLIFRVFIRHIPVLTPKTACAPDGYGSGGGPERPMTVSSILTLPASSDKAIEQNDHKNDEQYVDEGASNVPE
jgi:hypothetical protein